MQNALGSGVRFLWRAWRIIRWPIFVLIVLYFGAVTIEAFHLYRQSSDLVATIHSQKLTMADVDGSHLPPAPDTKLANATVEGIDANNNGIRDDVELAIYKKYPNDIKLRAAALQYSKAREGFLTSVMSMETWKATAEESGRASLCVSAVEGQSGEFKVQEFVNNLVFNTENRERALETASRFTTSYGSSRDQICDIAF